MKFLLKFPECLNVIKNAKYYSSSAAKNTTSHYDVVISGGGMVGFAMACSLGKRECLANKRVLLLESSPPKEFNPKSYNLRVSALSPGSKQLLQSLGAWSHIQNTRSAPVKKMEVWDACSDAAITFGKADLSDEIAWIVENDLVQSSLIKEVMQHSNIDVQYNRKVSNYKIPASEDQPVQVTLEDGSLLTTDLIIGADGFNSGLRKTMNTQYITYDYKQLAVVATLRISEVGENVTAWQKFLPTGPIALLPLTKELSSLVWSTDVETAKCLRDLPPDMFTDRINQALWSNEDINPTAQNVSEKALQILKMLQSDSSEHYSSDVRQLPPSVVDIEGRQAVFPLSLGHSVDYISCRSVLIGDAAHRVHPLAGQGVNLGFGDVTVLTDVICDAVRNGSDHGSYLYLKDYQSKRLVHNLSIMAAIQGLHLLYRTTWTPLVAARSVGLNVINSFVTVKELLTKRASS